MILWMFGIAISVCLLVLTAAVGEQVPAVATLHLFVAGAISTVMALLAIKEARKLIVSGASQMFVAATLMRFMGLVWAWVALVISITYSTQLLQWSDWLQYFIGFVVLSGLCLFLSSVLMRDALEGRTDEQMLQASRYIATATLLVMVIAALVIAVSRVNGLPVPESGIWAAQNVFVFGSFALAAISSYLLKASVDEAS